MLIQLWLGRTKRWINLTKRWKTRCWCELRKFWQMWMNKKSCCLQNLLPTVFTKYSKLTAIEVL
jgi:hypothetical protein